MWKQDYLHSHLNEKARDKWWQGTTVPNTIFSGELWQQIAVITNSTTTVCVKKLDKWNEFISQTLQWKIAPKNYTVDWVERHFHIKKDRNRGSTRPVSNTRIWNCFFAIGCCNTSTPSVPNSSLFEEFFQLFTPRLHIQRLFWARQLSIETNDSWEWLNNGAPKLQNFGPSPEAWAVTTILRIWWNQLIVNRVILYSNYLSETVIWLIALFSSSIRIHPEWVFKNDFAWQGHILGVFSWRVRGRFLSLSGRDTILQK